MTKLALVPAAPQMEAPQVDAFAAPAAAGRSGRRKRLVLGALLTAILMLVGYFAYQYFAVWRHQESTDNAYVRADITPVAPKVEGYVARLLVEDNQRVRAGDVLLVLDSGDFGARLDQAEAELAAAQAAVKVLHAARTTAAAQTNAQSDSTHQAQAQLAAAEAAAMRAQADETRFGDLARKGWVSQARLDQVRAEARAARAQVIAARAVISGSRAQSDALQSGTNGASAGIAGGQAQVLAARAAVRAARLDMDRTIIRAPVSGIVANRAVRAGQFVRAGQQLLAVVPIETSYVVANFKETQLKRMRVGQPVTLHLDAYGDRAFHGRVESLSPASGAQFALIPTDTATGNFTRIVQRVPVRIRIQRRPGDPPLRPGLSVEATVDVGD